MLKVFLFILNNSFLDMYIYLLILTYGEEEILKIIILKHPMISKGEKKMLRIVQILIFLVVCSKCSTAENFSYVNLMRDYNLPVVHMRQGLTNLQKVHSYPMETTPFDQTLKNDNVNQQYENNLDNINTASALKTLHMAKYEEAEPLSGEYSDRYYRPSDLKLQIFRTDSEDEPLDSLCHTPTSVRKIERLNRTKTTDNGKIYLLTKVIKSRKCKKMPNNKEIQRRTFNVLGNFLPLMPIPWMTKKEESGAEMKQSVREYKTVQNPHKSNGYEDIQTEIGSVTQKVPINYNTDKIKKVLNLFTIIKFDNDGCYANGLEGTCLHQTECQAKAGRSIGTCAKGFGICCYVERTCGEQTRENCSYFVNEGFPKPSTKAPNVCTLVVLKAHPEVEQLRIEFVVFELRGPNNGTCISDRLTITGHNTNHIIPDICGINNQQHVYVDVDEAEGPYNLNIITMPEGFPRTFQIKITQIGKFHEYFAPKNCLQYYTEKTGIIQTFNYQYNDLGNLPQAIPGYFNNLNYAICFKKQAGFCSISYENNDKEDTADNPSFQLLNTDLDGERLLPPNQGGAEIFDCPDDYIIVNGIRLCGEKLNDATIDADYTKSYPVTDFSNGPFILQVRTNNAINGRGFYLKYRQNPCLQ